MKNTIDQTTKSPRRGAFTATVTNNPCLTGTYKSMTLELTGRAAKCFAQAHAGQFVQIACRRLNDRTAIAPLLRRPFSIAALDTARTESDTASIRLGIIYDVLGPGTRWLADRQPGHQVDVVGPLGRGFTLPKDKQKQIFLIGGGVGVPPLYTLAKELAENGHHSVIAFAGVRTGDSFPGTLGLDHYDATAVLDGQMLVHEFARHSTPTILASDDGSLGFNGNIVQAAAAFLDNDPQAHPQIYACGPKVMLKATAQMAARQGLACQVCLEEYMACGIGVCQSCVVATGAAAEDSADDNNHTRYQLVCTNGPVFDAETVIWD